MRKCLPLLLALLCCAPSTADAATQYSLAHGCYAVGDQPSLRMKPAALGKYLLYTSDGKYATPSGARAKPDGDAVWTADADGGGFTGAGGVRLEGPVTATTGCAEFPEAGLSATGRPVRSKSPIGDVKGVIDQHAHMMGFELFGGDFHCGRPWSPLGITVALPDCESIQGEGGTSAPVQNFLDYGQPVMPHDTVGWPTFNDWPTHEKLSYEQNYYRWIERAYLAGVRMIQNNVTDNETLCKAITRSPKSLCTDESTTLRQLAATYQLQDYIDAQAGGPGKGWFRIVTSPWQARKVINQGKMAVNLGVELSSILGCDLAPSGPQCTQEEIDAGIDLLWAQGVRVFYPVHKIDNALGGTKMDGGAFGLLVNLVANKGETGHYWNIETCKGEGRDRDQLAALPPGIGELFGQLNADFGAVPSYPATPHCNAQGLTDLGKYVLQRMMDKRFVIEVDHMSAATSDGALTEIEARRYPGVISSHSWSTEKVDNPRIRAVGGMVSSGSKSAVSFVESWKYDRSIRNPNTRYGIGYGADQNGLAEQAPPRPAGETGPPVSYPFKSEDGRVTFDRLTTGQQTWDINEDGVAHYGLLADWLEDVRMVGGEPVIRDMFNSAEAYIEMWERAWGVPEMRRVSGRVVRRGVGPVRLGTAWKTVLRRAGQPRVRPGSAFRWRGGTGAFFRGGKVVLVGRAGGSGAVKLRGRYVLRGGRRVAVTSLRGPGKVKAALKAAGI